MAQLTFTIPDDLVPRIVASIQFAYPDLTGTPAQITRAGMRRLLADQLARAESRTAEVNGYNAMLAAAESARQQAKADAEAIT